MKGLRGKIISIILTIALATGVFSVNGITAKAEAVSYYLYMGNNEVTSENTSGEGWSYDPENSVLTYTFEIENTGNTEAAVADNVVLSDTFNPVLSDITVTLDGSVQRVGVNYTYDEPTGVFATVAGQIIVPAVAQSGDDI